MIFHKESKQAFVFPPKCGTQTTKNFLDVCKWKNLGMTHVPTRKHIILYPNLKNYRIYAWFRDPVLRLESGILYIKQIGFYTPILDKFLMDQGINKTRETVTYEELIDVFPEMVKNFDVIFHPQADWYDEPNVIPLDFNNMEAELRRITGNYDSKFMILNKSYDFGRMPISDKVRNFVREYYAADYAVAKERMGKEY